MIDIDGSRGEGGGQILRSSLALSILTGQPCQLRRIRAGRPKPGLQAQHLTSVRAAAAVGSAQVSGDHLGSQELTFTPGTVAPGKHHFNIGTAGATGLVLHTVYLPLALGGGGEVWLEGGTHVRTSPTYPFLASTWRGYLVLMGLDISLTLQRAGFFPRGGGQIVASIPSIQRLQPLRLLQPTTINTARVHSIVAGLSESIARRQANQAVALLRNGGIAATSQVTVWDGGPGTALVIELATQPVPTVFVGIGERGKSAEKVAADLVSEVMHHARSGAVVDPHSADQLVLPAALANGESVWSVSEVTQHLLTNIEVIQTFLDCKIHCPPTIGQPATVRVEGCGLLRSETKAQS